MNTTTRQTTYDYINKVYLKKQRNMKKGIKVVIAGPSGSGKTTLAKKLAEYFGWNFEENSAGLIMSAQQKEELNFTFGYSGNWGQKKVINESHSSKEFGKHFQEYVLAARYEMYHKLEGENCIFDRSFIDPMVYWLNQVVHNSTQEETEHFMHRCIAGLRNVDLLLRLPLQNPNQEIEDNNSRVPNWYFQKKIDFLFDAAIQIVSTEQTKNPYLLGHHQIKFSACPMWEWDHRFAWAIKEVASVRSAKELSGE